MENPKISVIVPVYRVEPYLRKCVESIVHQTYRNLEIILVEDGSPDSCGAICDEYAARDGRVQVIHKPNGGVASARNAGLAASTGEWIGWVDSDDWIEPDMYEYLLRLALLHHADLVQCGIWFEEDGKRPRQAASPGEASVCMDRKAFSPREWERLSNQVYNKLYRRTALEDVTFNSAYPIGEDLLFVCSVLRNAGRVALGEQVKYHYRQREDSICHTVPTRESAVSLRQVLLRAMSDFSDDENACAYFFRLLIRNDLDMCSKIVRFRFPGYEDVRAEVCGELKRSFRALMGNKNFSPLERAKIFLIAKCWPAYCAAIVCRHL